MRLNGSINSVTEVIVVTGLASTIPEILLIDYEYMKVVSVNGCGFRVTRGFKGTVAASHNDQAVIHSDKYNPSPVGLIDSNGHKILLGTNLTLTNNVLDASGGSGGGDLSSAGSYANPSWITSLAGSKLTGSIVATNGVVTTTTYSDPSWITSLAANKLTGSIVATNGVVTTTTYSDPSWITSLAFSKITGSIVATNGIVSTGNYDDPAWIIGLAASKLTGSIVATNGIVSTSNYSDPAWITSLAASKIVGNISGNAVSLSGNITESQVTNLTTDLSAKESLSNKNANSGYCGLDSSGKVATAQLPSVLAGSLTFKGTWDALSNTPTLTSSSGTSGFYYKISAAGSTTLDGISSWDIGDLAIYDGTIWEKITNVETVSSVNGQIGAVNLASTDLSNSADVLLASGTYSDPSWLSTLAFTKISGTIIADDGLISTATYSNPSWLTSIDGSIVSGNISGNATSISGTITENQVTNLTTDLSAKEVTTNKNANNGYCGLDAAGKVATSQLPAALVGSVNYQGVWNATTNSPALVSSVGTKGYYYKVSTAGTTNLNGNNVWAIGDWAIYNGTTWDRLINTDTISSVNGQTGIVSLASTNLTNSSVIVLTSGSYANPSWITSLDASKLTGSIVATNGVVTTGSYANPSWISSINANKIVGNVTITNGVVTTGNYANPAWITSLASSKITGSFTESQITNLTADLAAKAPLASPTLVTPKFNSTLRDITTDTDAATITFDLSLSDLHMVTLGGNRTLALSNTSIGKNFIIILKQDATGSRTVTWFSGIIWSGFTPSLNTTPGKYDVFEFIKITSTAYIGKVVMSEVYSRPNMLG